MFISFGTIIAMVLALLWHEISIAMSEHEKHDRELEARKIKAGLEG